MQKQKGIGVFIGFGAVFLIAPSGCAGLKLQMFDHSVHKPSNVAVYFSVETRNGQPVANLTPQDFRIYEDKQPVSVLESKQTILNPEVAAIHYTLLLIDMSGSVVDSGDMPALIQAASTFGDRVGPYQKVAVYTFDGSPHLTPVVSFGGNVRAGVSALGSRRPRDPSTNLNGAVIEGIRVLGQQMEHAPVPLRFGTLVVFTDGTDRAHRASAEDVDRTLDAAGPTFETYVIGAGQEVDASSCRASAGRGRSRRRTAPTCSTASTRSRRASRRRRRSSICCRTARPAAPASTRSRLRRTGRGPAAGSRTVSTPTASGPTATRTRARRST